MKIEKHIKALFSNLRKIFKKKLKDARLFRFYLLFINIRIKKLIL